MTVETVSVTVKLFSNLRRFVPMGHDGRLEFTLPPGATVADVLARIGIPADEELTVAIDDELAARDTVLNDGDEVTLIAPMEGGSASAISTTDTQIGDTNSGGRHGRSG